MMNTAPSERFAIAGVLDPDSVVASTVQTVWISMANFHTMCAVLSVGDMVATSTIDAQFRQATDVSGTGAKVVANTAITQLVAATNSNDQVVVNLRSTDLDVANGFSFVEFQVVVAAAASELGVTLLGFDPRHTPTSDLDLASVVEIVG